MTDGGGASGSLPDDRGVMSGVGDADDSTARGPVAPGPPVPHRPSGWLWLPVVLAAALLVVALGAFVARNRGHDCTLRGCAPTVAVDLAPLPAEVRDAAAAATVCADDACTTQPVVAGQFVRGNLPGSVVGSASVVLVDGAGAEVARFDSDGPLTATLTFPNGPDCDPPCPLLRLAVAAGGTLVVVR